MIFHKSFFLFLVITWYSTYRAMPNDFIYMVEYSRVERECFVAIGDFSIWNNRSTKNVREREKEKTHFLSDFDGFDVICILLKLTNKSKWETYHRKKEENNMELYKNLNCTYRPQKSKICAVLYAYTASESVTLEIKLTLTVCVCLCVHFNFSLTLPVRSI